MFSRVYKVTKVSPPPPIRKSAISNYFFMSFQNHRSSGKHAGAAMAASFTANATATTATTAATASDRCRKKLPKQCCLLQRPTSCYGVRLQTWASPAAQQTNGGREGDAAATRRRSFWTAGPASSSPVRISASTWSAKCEKQLISRNIIFFMWSGAGLRTADTTISLHVVSQVWKQLISRNIIVFLWSGAGLRTAATTVNLHVGQPCLRTGNQAEITASIISASNKNSWMKQLVGSTSYGS